MKLRMEKCPVKDFFTETEQVSFKKEVDPVVMKWGLLYVIVLQQNIYLGVHEVYCPLIESTNSNISFWLVLI